MWPGILALLAVICVGCVQEAQAQAAALDQGVLWLAEGPDEEVAEVLAGVREALAGESAGHLLGGAALEQRTRERARPMSSCAFGVEPCGAAEALVFDALDLGLLIRLTLRRGASTVEGNYEMVDRRGGVATSGRLIAPTSRDLGFELVRELFDAVGILTVDVRPAGAAVYVDDEYMGESPLSGQFAVGSYEVRVELAGFDTLTEELEIRAGVGATVEGELTARPGTLQVRGAPAGAVVWVDDEEIGPAEDALSVPAGTRQVEVRAEGYEPYRQEVVVAPEVTTELDVELARMRFQFREPTAAAILDTPFQFDLGLQLGTQQATFHDASGRIGDETYQFQGWLQDGLLADDGALQRQILPRGIHGQAAYEGRTFGVSALSFSYLRQPLNHNARLRPRGEGRAQDVRVRQLSTLQVRPLQVRARFFYENLAPYGQVGLGFAVQTLRGTLGEDDESDPFRLRRVRALGALELGVRYHLDPRISVGAAYRQQRYLDSGLGTEHSLGISVGLGLRQVPFLELQPPGEL